MSSIAPQSETTKPGKRHSIVRAHERVRATFANARLEVRQVTLAQVALADDGVEAVTLGLRAAVDSEMFHGGNRLQILRIIALQPMDELHRQPAGEQWIFAVRLLSAPPTRIAKEVDVRRPDREALVPLSAARPHVLVMLRAGFVGNDGRHAEHEAIVPRCGEADRLRKHGRQPRSGHAVKRFVPPVVFRNAKPLDRRRDILHL